MRVIKRLLLGLLVVVVVVLAAAVIFVSTADFNEYKETIAAELKAATGRDVTIGGPIETKIVSMHPAIVLNDLAIANVSWGTRKEMVRLRRLEVQVALFPLILGQVTVKRMVAVEPDILLETDKAGRQNWVFAGALAATKAKAAGQSGGPSVTFRKMRILRARVAYRDGTTGDVDRFGVDSLSAATMNGTGAMSYAATGSFDGKAVDIKGRIGPPGDLFARRAVELRFSATLGHSDLAGNLVLQIKDKISLKGRVRSDRVDFADFGVTSKDKRIFGSDPLPVGLLRILNADVSYKAKTFKTGGTPMANVSAAVRVANGLLTVSKFGAVMAGGALRGRLSLNAASRPAKFSTQSVLTRLSLNQITPAVSGPMSVDIAVAGVGDSARAIASTLSGRTSLTGGPGRVANDGLILLTFGIGSLQKFLTRGSVRAENVNCVVARFDFADGVGRSRVLVTDTARLTFIGQGTVNLKNEQMNLLFVPRTKETGLGDVAIHPVRLAGPIMRPAASVDTSAAAKEAAKNIIGVARRSLNFVGSLVGVTKRESRSGSPCSRAIAVAGGKQAPVCAGSSRLSGSGKAPARPRRKKGLLRRLNPFE
ncbi:MAG: AsmA family protein [Alphaproteobacteria bacterium]|nr:AsmA family protein [Alphaproteobacteria bacterium]